MACHTQIQADSPRLEAVRKSWQTGQPLKWVRVHRVPDYSYFNHAVHVSRGVRCQSCHGAVNEMKTVFQQQPQSMSWCLDCHRASENFRRPALASPEGEEGLQPTEALDVNPPVTCGGCHR